ncbi:hypothetical protein FJZ53_06985 [Candidatus Woesearchaeota archaeon]|nr:hypothetical protein [Candidatus Woesearchaeota archaeon]
MKIFICCSKHFYDKVKPVKEELEKNGHEVTLPNSFEDPYKEEKLKQHNLKEHAAWKASMLRLQEEKIKKNDAILVLNFEKNGMKNYIGGATFLEIFKAFELKKKIFLLNPLPDNVFKDELSCMSPVILNGDLSGIE